MKKSSLANAAFSLMPFSAIKSAQAHLSFDALNKLHLRRWSTAALLVFTILPPILVYAITPRVYEALDLNLLKTRPVPGRDISYFLQPWKNGRTEAADWAREFVAAVPSEAVIYADFTLARVLSYRLKTSGDRPDLDVVEVDQWFYDPSPDGLVESIQGSLSANRTVVIAQDFDPIYKIRALRDKFRVEEGPLFLLIYPNSGGEKP